MFVARGDRTLRRMKHQLLLASAVLSVAVVGACSDPVGDAPRATVTTPTTTPPATTPPATTPPPTTTTTPAAGTTRYVFADDGTQQGATVSFVGAKVTGKHAGGFKKVNGTIDVAGDVATVDVTIDMASVFTDNEKLTGHLQTPDLFDVAKFPTARFTSKSITKNADGTSTVSGDFTLHGVTKTISFPATVAVTADGATAQAAFGINRKDFGIVYPGKPDDLINDEVLLKLDVKAKKAA